MKRLPAFRLADPAFDAGTPFQLELREGSWLVLEVLRSLPGRRLVVRARQDVSSDEEDRVLKLFFGRGHRRYLRRERRGLDRLSVAGLKVPERKGEIAEPGLSGLILEYLPDARPVRETDREAVEAIAGYFGRLHAAGYRQSDPHLANFVISGGTVYAIDGDGVRRCRGPFRTARERANLAMLAAQRSPEADAGLAGLLASYGDGRNSPRGRDTDRRHPAEGSHPAPPPGAFQVALDRARRKRMRSYLKKTLRDCSEFMVSRGARRHTYALRGRGEQALETVLEAVDGAKGHLGGAGALFSGEVLKAGNSATVVRTGPPRPVVIKRYNIKNARHALRRMLRRQPRFRRSWMYGQLLGFLKVPVARPLALVEERRGFWRGVAWLVLEDLEGSHLAAEAAGSGLSDARIEEVVELFRRLRSFGLSHGDTKATNFLIHHGRVHLIDLDAMDFSERGLARDVRRFLDNWNAADRGRFEAAFRQAGLLS